MALETLFGGSNGRIYTHTGLADASAAQALSKNRFIVAGDEKNTFYVYIPQRMVVHSSKLILEVFKFETSSK